MVSYWCFSVTLCLKRIVFEIFDFKVYSDLETRFGGLRACEKE